MCNATIAELKHQYPHLRLDENCPGCQHHKICFHNPSAPLLPLKLKVLLCHVVLIYYIRINKSHILYSILFTLSNLLILYIYIDIHNLGGMAIAIPCDHSIDTQVETLFNTIDINEGRLDILINNAFQTPRLPSGVYDSTLLFKNFYEQPPWFWDALHSVGMYVWSYFYVIIIYIYLITL